MSELPHDLEYGRDIEPDAAPLWAWMVTMTYAGRVLRWTSRDVELTLAERPVAPPMPFDPGDLEVAEELSMTSASAPVTVSLTLFFPEDLPVAQYDLRGTPLAGVAAEVALVRESDRIEDRHVVLQGFVSEPEYGDVDEPVSFTIRGPEQDVDTTVPAVAFHVQPRNWYTIVHWDPESEDPEAFATSLNPPENTGLAYPIVWGAPGVLAADDGTVSYVPGSPAIVVRAHVQPVGGTDTRVVDTILVAGGTVAPGTEYVELIRSQAVGVGTGGVPYGYTGNLGPVTNAVDGAGTPCVLVDTTGWDADGESRQATTWYVAWAFGPAGALEGCPARPGLGDLTQWWMERSGLQWDLVRSRRALDFLNAFRTDGYANEDTDPRSWIADHVEHRYPTYVVEGPTGLYLAAIPWRRSDLQAVATVTVGDGTAVRASRVETTGDRRYTEVRVSWGRNIADETWGRTTVWSPADTWTGEHAPEAALDGSVLQRDRKLLVELPHCYDEGTARLVAEWTWARDAEPSRRLEVMLDAARWASLGPGDVVTLVDATLGLAHEAVVVGRSKSDSAWWPYRFLIRI